MGMARVPDAITAATVIGVKAFIIVKSPKRVKTGFIFVEDIWLLIMNDAEKAQLKCQLPKCNGYAIS
jgi:hypothetical protein